MHAPVIEIYGSTETGALATRRTAREPRWQPLDGVRLERVDGATLVRGAHFPSPAELARRVGSTPTAASCCWAARPTW